MKQELTCIECPKGCRLSITVEDGKVVSVVGNQCPKGEKYGTNEIQNPVRELTSTVRAKGLSLQMIPVKTSQAIPKDKIFAVMEEIKKVIVTRPVNVGDVILSDILALHVDLISTRKVI